MAAKFNIYHHRVNEGSRLRPLWPERHTKSYSPCWPLEMRSCSPFWTTVMFPKAWLSFSVDSLRFLVSIGLLSYNTRQQSESQVLLDTQGSL